MFEVFTELSEAIRMEVEISRQSLDCSRYGPVAVVADNSHVVLLGVAARAKEGALLLSLTPLMPQGIGPTGMRIC